MRITFLGAGSTVFAKNILGDCILTPELGEFEIALYDIDTKRLEESFVVIQAINKKYNGKATVYKFTDIRDALKGANYIVNAVQIGGYKPSTVIDFAIPNKYGLKQTIADTLGVGGIMRALRTIPVLQEFAKHIEEICPKAYFINYTNPMAMLTGYLQKYTKVNAVGLCHSVQVCVPELLQKLKIDMKEEDTNWDIFGINHQAWLLKLKDKNGNDLYPLVKEKELKINAGAVRKVDSVRFELMRTFGYYLTESSEHSSEYVPWFIKRFNPALIGKYCIPLNEYPRRCRWQIKAWKKQVEKLKDDSFINHERSKEYCSRIIEAIHTNKPYVFHGSVLNTDGIIPNLDRNACVEVPIVASGKGLKPQQCYDLPMQLKAINDTNINTQLLTLKANETRKIEDVVMAVAMDPHTGAVLSLDKIKKMVKEMLDAHEKTGFLPKYN